MTRPTWLVASGQTQWTKPGASSLVSFTGLTATADSAAFIAADAFAGPKGGYVYKQGPQGTGYYKDQGPMAVQGNNTVPHALESLFLLFVKQASVTET